MDASSLAFLAQSMLIGLSIAAPVGPIGLLTIQRSLDRGWAAGFATGMGAAVADGIYGAIGAFGGCRVPGMPADLAAACPSPCPTAPMPRLGSGPTECCGCAPWKHPWTRAWALAQSPSKLTKGRNTSLPFSESTFPRFVIRKEAA